MPGNKATRSTTVGSRTRNGRPAATGETTQILPRSRDVTPLTRPPEMPPKRAEMIAQRIVRMIQEEGLKFGDALPVEADMHESFGVGRSTLREALRILELQGVIVIRPGRGGGPTVGLPDSRHLASTLALLMQFSDTPFRSVLETREYIEPIAAALCAQNGEDRVIDGLRQSVDAMRANISDETVFLYENHRFHELIAEGAQNPLISYFLNSLDWIIDGARLGVTYSPSSRKHVAVIHEQICEAIEDGDSDRARDAMSEHMKETRAFFERKHPKVMDQALSWGMYG
ncbi:FadR/GntR family transcriptional regulator [Rhodococcus oxybenzonivorans]|nr:FadR/GntR family transcriptional regulator [Rhodococcus oxybenzonivorans]MDV7272470.1 FadR/GntR family transcriptional regulator [Rhodococcus oxybenzonivorans]MDV7342960.1 FadR/GntR family transcriptional regulator [Rhodococcus oxybenzonivorans]